MAYLGELPYVPGEELDPQVDFTKNMPAGGSITDATQTSLKLPAFTDSTATIISGASVIAGANVTQRVHGALTGEQHLILWTITFNTGRKVIDAVLLVAQKHLNQP